MTREPKKDIYSFLREAAGKYGDSPALFGRHRTPQGDVWLSLSFASVQVKAETLARKLIAAGLKKGDRALLMATLRPEYSIAFFAISLAGGVIVPMDTRLNLADQKFISEFSEAKFILCTDHESQSNAEKLVQASAQSLQLFNVENIMKEASVGNFDLTTSVLDPDDVFILSFTSGTTSHPKAVMLTFANVYFQVMSAVAIYQTRRDFRLLSILPLHHMFEITMGFLLPFCQGGQVYYANSMIPHQIISFFKEKKIRNLLVVPLFLRALKKGIESEIKTSRPRELWFNWTYFIAAKIPLMRVRRWLFYPLHRKLGGQLHQVISGASALDPRVGRFFATLGIPIYEGYGMTETAPVISCSSKHHNKLGFVGKVLPGVQIRIDAETSEIQVKGPNVMKGYYKNPEATQAVLSNDGWFRTGDIGSVDAEGFLRIEGRNKDLIVLGSGKKVAPEEVENHLRDVPSVQEICVIGTESEQGATRGTEIVTAVVVINESDMKNQEQIQKNLNQAVQELSYYKRPAKFIFLTEALPKTTTFKIKKNLVKELLKKRITV